MAFNLKPYQPGTSDASWAYRQLGELERSYTTRDKGEFANWLGKNRGNWMSNRQQAKPQGAWNDPAVANWWWNDLQNANRYYEDQWNKFSAGQNPGRQAVTAIEAPRMSTSNSGRVGEFAPKPLPEVSQATGVERVGQPRGYALTATEDPIAAIRRERPYLTEEGARRYLAQNGGTTGATFAASQQQAMRSAAPVTPLAPPPSDFLVAGDLGNFVTTPSGGNFDGNTISQPITPPRETPGQMIARPIVPTPNATPEAAYAAGALPALPQTYGGPMDVKGINERAGMGGVIEGAVGRVGTNTGNSGAGSPGMTATGAPPVPAVTPPPVGRTTPAAGPSTQQGAGAPMTPNPLGNSGGGLTEVRPVGGPVADRPDLAGYNTTMGTPPQFRDPYADIPAFDQEAYRQAYINRQRGDVQQQYDDTLARVREDFALRGLSQQGLSGAEQQAILQTELARSNALGRVGADATARAMELGRDDAFRRAGGLLQTDTAATSRFVDLSRLPGQLTAADLSNEQTRLTVKTLQDTYQDTLRKARAGADLTEQEVAQLQWIQKNAGQLGAAGFFANLLPGVLRVGGAMMGGL